MLRGVGGRGARRKGTRGRGRRGVEGGRKGCGVIKVVGWEGGKSIEGGRERRQAGY